MLPPKGGTTMMAPVTPMMDATPIVPVMMQEQPVIPPAVVLPTATSTVLPQEIPIPLPSGPVK